MRLLLRPKGLEDFDALLYDFVEIRFVFGMRRSHGQDGGETERGGGGVFREEEENRLKRRTTAESRRESA